MEVPAEKLDYLALLNPKYVGKHDALAVVDVDPLPLSSERTTSCGIGIIEEKCWWATETLRSGLS